jgi:CRP-like cAMP-binding protein
LKFTGDATDDDFKERVLRLRAPPPIADSPDAQHLSASAIDLLSKLMEPDPKKRLKAHEMLQHSWVTGETARSDVMAGSDKRLSRFRKFRSRIETKVFQELVSWSESEKRKDPSQRGGTSLVEKAFSSLDKDKKGFLTVGDVAHGDEAETDDSSTENDASTAKVMSLSAFSDLLGDHMVNKFFPRGHVVYHEGDIGEHMYFINSGTVAVSTEDGFHATLGHGDTFGEGGLLNENKKRSATIKTISPIHTIRIDRECFKKYLGSSESALAMKLKEKVNTRKFGRTDFIVGQQINLQPISVPKGGTVFSEGDKPEAIYILSEGRIDVNTKGNTIYSVKPGELFGVQSFFMNRPRGASAVCVSSGGCKLKAMTSHSFEKLLESSPKLEESLRELSLRREFRRAIVLKLKKSFGKSRSELQEVFDEIDLDKTGRLNIDEVRDLLTHLDKSITEEALEKMIQTLDLQKTGYVSFEEFRSVFGSG